MEYENKDCMDEDLLDQEIRDFLPLFVGSVGARAFVIATNRGQL